MIIQEFLLKTSFHEYLLDQLYDGILFFADFMQLHIANQFLSFAVLSISYMLSSYPTLVLSTPQIQSNIQPVTKPYVRCESYVRAIKVGHVNARLMSAFLRMKVIGLQKI